MPAGARQTKFCYAFTLTISATLGTYAFFMLNCFDKQKPLEIRDIKGIIRPKQ
tara:strand:- start:207 stop:365 length:159 start_codon:yes stop_codon:yes gene_type:complete